MSTSGRTAVTVAAIAAAVAASLGGTAVALWCANADTRLLAVTAFNNAVVIVFTVVGP